MKLSQIRRDKVLDAEGAWQEVPNWPGVELKVRPMNNPDFKRLQGKLLAELMQLKMIGLPDDQKMDEQEIMRRMTVDGGYIDVTKQCVEQTVLLDWRGIEDEDGELQPYHPEIAHICIHDSEQFPDFCDEVIRAARAVEKKAKAAKDQILGNSPGLSAGPSNGADTSPSSID